MEDLEPIYDGICEPRFPCRIMETRHCPVIYNGLCGDRPCARYESNDEGPWIDEVMASARRNGWTRG